MKVRDLAHSRTGDKGNISNISVIAFDRKDYPQTVAGPDRRSRQKAFRLGSSRATSCVKELPQLGRQLRHGVGPGRRRHPVAGARPAWQVPEFLPA